MKTDAEIRDAVFAGFAGWALDAFDFFVLVFLLGRAGTEFHKQLSDMTLALTATLMFRPIGAMIFGLFADRYGRRNSMVANLIFFSIMEALSGMAPNFGAFMACRALFGIGMGGYWGAAAALSMEQVTPRWRGIASGLLQQGYPCGYLLAAYCYRFTPESWGWRPFFLVGCLPGLLLAFFTRYRVTESTAWKESERQSISSYVGALAKHGKLFLYLVVLMTAMNMASHGTQDLYPSFLEKQRHMTKTQAGNIAIIYNVGALLGGISFGFFSDRIGRRRAMVAAFALAALAIPLWSAAPTMGLLVMGAFLMQFLVQGAWGVIPAHINELSPAAVRGFMPGFAYQCGVFATANAAHLEAGLSKNDIYSKPMAFVALTTFVVGAIVIFLGPEKRAARMDADS